jgi:hypothetical protein
VSKLVLADYFLGFSTREISGRARPWRLYYESEEDAGIKPPRCDAAFSGDLYLNGDIRDIASTYYPAIGPYDVEDPAVVEYHVLLAKAAGIDGFMAEFTLGQEKKLLSLVKAATKYDFKIGVNWITQSHLAENTWPDRAAAIDKARELVRWMVEHVYKPCGVRLRARYLMLAFLAHPREASKPFDPFFSPTEVAALKQTAIDAGCEMDIFTLPWESVSETGSGKVWDGYFPWVWSSSGSNVQEDACWSRVTTRQEYIERLRAYYDMCKRLKQQGRIGDYIGAALPGFDDHKGQAWGEGLKRYLPRDGGQTLTDTWDELEKSGVDAVLIITWNDWIESSQIEPSLELLDADLAESARRIAKWNGGTFQATGLSFPKRLLDARRALRHLADAEVPNERLASITAALDRAATTSAVEELANAERSIVELQATLEVTPIHLFWEFGFDSIGIRCTAPPPQKIDAHGLTGLKLGSGWNPGFAIEDQFRTKLQRGRLVARLAIEYLDSGVDFIRVLVDASGEAHREIASFKKSDTGRWRTASMDLVNGRVGGEQVGVHADRASRARPLIRDDDRGRGGDIEIWQRAGTGGGVRSVRIDGIHQLSQLSVNSRGTQ